MHRSFSGVPCEMQDVSGGVNERRPLSVLMVEIIRTLEKEEHGDLGVCTKHLLLSVLRP